MGTANTKKPLPNHYRPNSGPIDLAENLEQFEHLSSGNNNILNGYDPFTTTNVEADFNNRANYDPNATYRRSSHNTQQQRSEPSKIIHNFKPYSTDTYRAPPPPPVSQPQIPLSRNDLPITSYELDNERRQTQYYQPRVLEPNLVTNPRPLVPDFNYVPKVQTPQPVLVPHNINIPILTRNTTIKEDNKNKVKYLKTLNKNNINPAVVNPTQSTLKKLYDIQPYEMRKLQKLFFQFAGSDRKMNFQEFVKLYGNINPSLRGPDIVNIAEQAFLASDTNDDGLLNFDEFLIAYCLTKPDRSFAGFPDLWKPSVNHFNENSASGPMFNTLRKNMLPYHAQQPETNNFVQPLPIEYQQQPTVEVHQVAPVQPAAPLAIEQKPQLNPPQQLHQSSQPLQNTETLPTSINQTNNNVQTSVPMQQPIQSVEAYNGSSTPPPVLPMQQINSVQQQPQQHYYHQQYPQYQQYQHQQQQQNLPYYIPPSYDDQDDRSIDYNKQTENEYGYEQKQMSEYHPPSEFSPFPQFDLNLLPPAPSVLASSQKRRHRSAGTMNKSNYHHYYHAHQHHHHSHPHSHHYHHHGHDDDHEYIDKNRHTDDHPPLFDLDDPASYKPIAPPRHNSTRRRQRRYA